MKPQPPLVPFDVCWSHIFNLARILGYFTSNPESAYFWKFPQHPSRSGKSLSPFGGYYVDYGGDHAFGDSFKVGSFAQNCNLAIQN